MGRAGGRRRCRCPTALLWRLAPGATNLHRSALDMRHMGLPSVERPPHGCSPHPLRRRVQRISHQYLRFPPKKALGPSWAACARSALSAGRSTRRRNPLSRWRSFLPCLTLHFGVMRAARGEGTIQMEIQGCIRHHQLTHRICYPRSNCILHRHHGRSMARQRPVRYR